MNRGIALALKMLVGAVIVYWSSSATPREGPATKLDPPVPRTAILSDNEIERPQPIAGDNVSNSAFGVVDQITLNRLQPTIDARFFSNGTSDDYIQHSVVEINTEQLKYQLETAWIAKRDQQETLAVHIPLSSDFEARIEVANWLDTSFGTTQVEGKIQNAEARGAYSSMTFGDSGRLDAVVNLKNGGFLIASVGEEPYYVIIELGPMPANTTLD